MPEIPVEQPVATPNSPYSSSGTGQVSGVAGTSAFTGDWFVETQSLNVNYHRVARGSLSSFDLDLDSVSGQWRHNQTHLISEVTANYEGKRITGNFQTSAWQQPQKFDVLGFSADSLGNTYGTLTASSLGPVGSIVTSQQFYSRVPWANQDLATKEMTALTYWGKHGEGATVSSVDPQPYNDSYDYWFLSPCKKGTALDEFQVEVGGAFHQYQLPGTYTVGQENNLKLIQFLDDLGFMVTALRYYAIPTTLNVHKQAVYDQGFAEYDRTRHDYS